MTLNEGHTKPARRGFNLLEVILAGFIFATITASMVGVWITYAKATSKGRSLLVATHLAERVMEQQLALGWSAVSLDRDEEERRFVVTQSVDGAESRIAYYYWVDVEDLSDTSDPLNLGLKKIVVTVEWQSPEGSRTVSCESLVYWGG